MTLQQRKRHTLVCRHPRSVQVPPDLVRQLEVGCRFNTEHAQCLQAAEERGGARGGERHLASWHRVGLRQLSGLLLVVLARAPLAAYTTCVASGAVPTGVGGFGGNKGAAAVALQLFRQRLLFLNCHFAAHQVRARELCGTCAVVYVFSCTIGLGRAMLYQH
jgi:hypothetical protein